jgi:hypothetical protein
MDVVSEAFVEFKKSVPVTEMGDLGACALDKQVWRSVHQRKELFAEPAAAVRYSKQSLRRLFI